MSSATLDTPSPVVDLDAVDRNIARVQAYCDEHGIAFRPHIKTHKLPEVARRQVMAGAIGIACQKLGEAEVMADAGLDDILLTFPLVGPDKARRFAALASRVRMSTAADSAAAAEGLSRALAAEGAEAGFLIDVDTGLGRTGVQTPQEAAELALLVARLPGLRFDGLMTYPTGPSTADRLEAAKAEIERAGLDVRIVSGGGTPHIFESHTTPVVTEVRAGTYVYGDRACIADGTASLDDCALRVEATVVSRPTAARAILDAGSKTLSSDPVPGHPELDGFGFVVEHPGARLYALNEEHGYLDVAECHHPPAIGDVVTIVPNHACVVSNLHDQVVVRQARSPAAVWIVAARGLVR
jgi:D-serine deaminase-like pyridoxal phosphate-dependent protein